MIHGLTGVDDLGSTVMFDEATFAAQIYRIFVQGKKLLIKNLGIKNHTNFF